MIIICLFYNNGSDSRPNLCCNGLFVYLLISLSPMVYRELTTMCSIVFSGIRVRLPFDLLFDIEMLPTFRLMGKSTPALTRAFRATACRSGVIGSTADAKVTKDLGTAYPIGNL